MPSPTQSTVCNALRRRDFFFAFVAACLLVLPGLWTYTLIDPWEGHYAEVARRILEDKDWIALRWQSEAFHSKPALTPWLIAASMYVHGLATDGGFSGELLVSPVRTAWVVRLPFALCGVGGMLSVWFVLTRLASLRAGYIGLLVLGTTPFYLLVSRQAITDMPMVAAMTGAISFFVLALHAGERPLWVESRARRFQWVRAHHALLFLIALIALAQVLYNAAYFTHRAKLGPGMQGVNAVFWVTVPQLFGLLLLLYLSIVLRPMRHMRDCYLLWSYGLIGVSILAKGPPGAALAVLVCVLYLLSTGQLRLLRRLRLIEGLLVVALIATPWHVAVALRDGQPFLTEYIGHHWLKRAGSGVHMVNSAGQGTFTYFVRELGYGLWPFVGVLPAAVLTAWRGPCVGPRDHLRLVALIWSIAGLVLFTLLKTKFHHYILPALPGFALLVALWIDELWSGTGRAVPGALTIGAVASALIGYDLFRNQDRLLELFVYRYDRPWPSAEPWQLDLSLWFAFFVAIFVVAVAVVAWRQFPRASATFLLGCALAFSVFAGNVYMPAVAPHWGQGQLHASYYQQRTIHGLTLRYSSASELIVAFPEHRRALRFQSFVPESLRLGTQMRVLLASTEMQRELVGSVIAIQGDTIVLELSGRQDWNRTSADAAPMPVASPQLSIDADPLIAWNLHWRSELFWSGGELWSSESTGHRMFQQGNDKEFLALLQQEEFRGRTIYLITESSQGARLRRLLPSEFSRQSLEIVDQTSNKFTLYRFAMSEPRRSEP